MDFSKITLEKNINEMSQDELLNMLAEIRKQRKLGYIKKPKTKKSNIPAFLSGLSAEDAQMILDKLGDL